MYLSLKSSGGLGWFSTRLRSAALSSGSAVQCMHREGELGR
jgi:hypothetical protein